MEWAFGAGHILHVGHAGHAALETETCIAAALQPRLFFLPGRRVLVRPEVVRRPREPRPHRLLLQDGVRRQLTAGGNEGAWQRTAVVGQGWPGRWSRPLGAGQAGLRGARRAGMKSTQGHLRQLDPEGEHLFSGGGGVARDGGRNVSTPSPASFSCRSASSEHRGSAVSLLPVRKGLSSSSRNRVITLLKRGFRRPGIQGTRNWRACSSRWSRARSR